MNPDLPEVAVYARTARISCLPADHDLRYEYTVRIEPCAEDRYAIKHLSRVWGTDTGWTTWSDGWSADYETESAWWASHSFTYDDALQHARRLASQLTYRGRTVADALHHTN
ncbi:hypothetical protein [Streptomyces sp. CC224B]|uniref:hypothetical protein n=1 Tax=Streptomyces sp. CC224B TaxID=3044571 RepID=UPI0024A89C68|nr:hypothetical protein [Streptomyces sp. CC224B]